MKRYGDICCYHLLCKSTDVFAIVAVSFLPGTIFLEHLAG